MDLLMLSRDGAGRIARAVRYEICSIPGGEVHAVNDIRHARKA
jgi:hypothetical protein